MKYLIYQLMPKLWMVLPLTREWIEIFHQYKGAVTSAVLPLTREWIEIRCVTLVTDEVLVLPLTREWIEITQKLIIDQHIEQFSLSRGSGLKSPFKTYSRNNT